MPRTSRGSRGGFVDHVLNRGNGRRDVFHNDDDFAAFVSLMREAHEKVPLRLTGYCLMTNHFHLRLWPHEDGDLSRWMQWLDAVAHDVSRPPLPSAPQRQRARLAGAIQSVSLAVQ